MSLVFPTATDNAALDAIWDKCDDGSGAGTVDITTSGGTVLATLTFSTTAFAASSAGTKTANAITSDTNAASTGTAAVCKFYDSDATLIATGSVGTSGENINLSTLSITAGDTVTCTSMTASLT